MSQRKLKQAQAGWPPALKELKDLLYQAYLAADSPSLDALVADIAADDDLPGSPSRDTIHRCISSPGMPSSQADVVSVAATLARRAGWDAAGLATQAHDLWVKAQMQAASPAGEPVGTFTDQRVVELLEVHRTVALEESDTKVLASLPAYVNRRFDARLREIVHDAVEDGVSGVAVLVGGSSTGKTRALWEAVRDLPDGWRLWRPIAAPASASEALEELNRVAPHTVLWLNEAQNYLAPERFGEQFAAALKDLIYTTERGPVLLLATLWPQHWDTLTRSHTEATPDAHPRARALLDSRVIPVPDGFGDDDQATLVAAAATDARLAQAAEHAADGQITQYLAGVPALMDRYAAAPPEAQALVHAAMDARRLGAGPLLPLTWLARAAPGYLSETNWHRLGDGDAWLKSALEYVTTPAKGVEILKPMRTTATRNQRNPRRAADPASVEAAREQARIGPMYRLFDFLEQYGSQHRREEIPPIDFWTAAFFYALPTDVEGLGHAAWIRGLYRDSAQLYKRAASLGSIQAAEALAFGLTSLDPSDSRPIRWVAAHVDIPPSEGHHAAMMLEMLHNAGAHEQFVEMANHVVEHVSLDNARRVAVLLLILASCGAREQVYMLLDRNPLEHAKPDNRNGLSFLRGAIGEVKALERIAKQKNHNPVVHVEHENPLGTESLPVPPKADDWYPPSYQLSSLETGRLLEQWTSGSLDRDTNIQIKPADLDEVIFYAWLRDSHRLARLLASDPVAHVALDDPNKVARLLETLRHYKNRDIVGAHEQWSALATRAAIHIPLGESDKVAFLLRELRRGEAHEQYSALATRVAAHIPLDTSHSLQDLMRELREAEALDQISTLVERAEKLPALGHFNRFLEVCDHGHRFHFGMEPDQSPAQPWAWEDLK